MLFKQSPRPTLLLSALQLHLLLVLALQLHLLLASPQLLHHLQLHLLASPLPLHDPSVQNRGVFVET